MKELKLTALDSEGNEKEHLFDLPESSKEVKYIDWLGFLKENSLINNAVKEEKPMADLAMLSNEAVRIIIPGIDDVYFPNPYIQFQVMASIRQKISEAFKNFQPPELPDPSTYCVEWHGERYYLTEARAKRVLGLSHFNAHTSIEYLEAQRLYQKELQTFQKEYGIHNYDKQFMIGIQSVALLLRKDSEKLPTTRAAIDAFLKERCQVFQDIPLSINQDVTFFLLTIWAKYGTTQNTSMHSMVSLGSRLVKNQPNSKGQTQERSQLQKI